MESDQSFKPNRALLLGPVATEMLRVIEPATEQVLAEIPQAGIEETDRAVARAKAAYPAWRAVTPRDRANLLRRNELLRSPAD